MFAWLVVVPESVAARNTARKDFMRTPSLPLRTLVARPHCGWPGRGPLGVDGAGSLVGLARAPRNWTQEEKSADGAAIEGSGPWGRNSNAEPLP